MSQRIEPSDQGKVNIERGLEALRQSSEFRGPVEPLDDHTHANDHFALIYETQEEQFAAAIPFLRQGLERGERCLYITYENSREEVLEAMRDHGVDVDAALESGALSIHTEREAYLRNETFDADDTISFLDDAIREATEEYEALRVTGEMSSVLEEDPDGEELVKCEAKANYLFDDVDGIALCQYNRARFPPEVIHDVISTHPHIIHDNRVSHNVYYTPPEEFFGPDKYAREVDRMMGTLRDQTEAKTELQDRERYMREQNEITASPDRSFEEKLQALFDLGCERFDLELGAMALVDPETDRFVIEYTSADHEHFEPGVELPLSETYCTAAAESRGPASVSDPFESGYGDVTVHEEFGLKAYLGTYVEVDGDFDRTFFFVSSEPRDEGFSDDERAFHRSMGQWVKYELEREQREAELQRTKEHFERVFESSHDAIFVLDPEADEFIDVNPAAYEMLGYTRDELLSVGPSGVYPDELDRFQTFIDEVFEDGAGWTDELTCRTKDGIRLPAEIAASKIEFDDHPVMLAAVRDISERREREQAQRTLYEIVAGSDRTFEEKLQALFDLGCERFDLELGGMARIDPATDLFEVDVMSGDHEHLVPGARVALSETYCRVIADGERTAGVSDPVDSGLEGTKAYEEFGVKAYLGTHVEVDGDVDRTLFFVSTEPRDREFSDEERTFHHLMGQWVEYELERRQAAEVLREHTHTLETINQVGNSLAAELDLENLVQEVTDAGTEITGAEFGAFFYNVIDDQGESYTLYTLSGAPDEAFEDFPMPRNTEVFGPTFHGEGVVRSDDITEDPRYGKNAPYKGMPEGHLPVCSYLAVPVISNSGEVLGGLFFGHSEPGIFTEKDENIITGIAAQAAIAIDNARLYETVRESEERFRGLVTASSDVVYRMSPDWSEMYHLEDKEFTADTHESTNDWLDKYVHPDDQERVMEVIDEAIQTKSILELEYQVEQADGSLGWTYWRAVPMLDEEGTIDEWIGMARDITERKEYEQELEQTNAQLEHSNEQLERSNAELKRFAYAASHDLQEPLRMVSSYLQLLEHRYADDLDADAQEYIEFAVDGADRMREMIDALLKYSRLERDGDEFEPVDCAVVLDEALDNLQIAIEENDAEITSDSLPTVMGDKQQLVQLFQNLLDNAITYAGDEPPHIHVTAEKPNGEWVLSVRDNGIGIDPDKIDGIFRVFNRLHTTDEFAGTGIGLAICQRIVDIHDGRIWVDSKPGEGSTFSFTIPDTKEGT